MADERSTEERFATPAGGASSRAVAEAAAALKTPAIQQAVRAFSGGGSAPDAAPAPEPASDRESEKLEDDTRQDDPTGGTSPSPAPAGDDDAEPEFTDDYDEEEHTDVPAEDETPASDRSKDATVAPATPKADDDVEKVWGQYKTEEERKKALAHNKRYAVTTAEENKRLKAELETLKTGKPKEDAPSPAAAADPAPASAPNKEDVAKAIYQSNPQVKASVDRLGALREAATERHKEITTLKAQIVTDEKEITKLAYRLEFLESDAKADPENYELQQRIAAVRNDLRELKGDANLRRTEQHRLEIELSRWQDEYQNGSRSFSELVEAEVRRTTGEAKARERHNEEANEAEQEWNAALEDVFADKALGIPVELREKLNERLLEKADAYFARGGKPFQMRQWVRSEAEKIAREEYAVVKDKAALTYAERKTADATPRAPQGKAAVAPEPRRERQSHRQADRDALANLNRSMRAR